MWGYMVHFLEFCFQLFRRAEANKMFDIDAFLVEFENLIFDDHLERIQSFKRRHGNAVSCSCFHINEEKENITKIMDKYYMLNLRFSMRLPLTLNRRPSSGDMSREEKIRTGSYDVVG